ncbi:hypothetical protein [Campylobacter sp. RM16190]|uniref:hypothetical protein n=1 Tax=Campylobacter sp. RM16190 TaxID=1705727 RepID=UPI0014763E06|nr:hypothetical protein [Campylobacter sp. RM16190]
MSFRDEKIMRGKTLNKANCDQIITHFYDKSSHIFIFIGFECVGFIHTLRLNYIVLKGIETLKSQQMAKQISRLQNKFVFLICPKVQGEDELTTDFKSALSRVKSVLFCVDFEVLKMFYLIQKSERKKNRYLIGIECKSKDLESFVDDEIKDFSGCDDKSQLSRITASLLREMARDLISWHG